jgi:hypothetical protein
MDEYHDDIRWAGAPRVAYPDVMQGEKNEARDVLVFFSVAVLTPVVATPPRRRREPRYDLRRRTTSNSV